MNVVFWQTDEKDQPAMITEPYEKAFTAANVKKELDFYESDLSFRVRVKVKGKEKTVEFTVKPKDNVVKKFKESMADAEKTSPSNGRTGTTWRMTNTSRTARTSRRF